MGRRTLIKIDQTPEARRISKMASVPTQLLD